MRKSFILLLISFGLCFLSHAQPSVQTGADRVDDYIWLLQGRRVAVCGNQTSMVGNIHLVDTLLKRNVNVVKIFCPEHGFRGNAEAGAHIASGTDPKTGLPIISLYGKNKKPTPEQMQNIDFVVFDLQDVGCRFYTYISTLHYVMEAAAENNIPVIVFDRPNPNGYFVDGPMLDPKFKSFVGMHPVPVVYGMTIGEYARMINGEGWLAGGIHCNLAVVTLKHYTHNTRYKLPVSPSPNLSNAESIYLYPSLCLFEGTNISVGRGTPLPFQIYGAPSLLAGSYRFTPKPIPGVSENPPHNGKECRGFYLKEYATAHLDSANSFNLQYLTTAYRQYPDKEHFFTNANFFDKLAGTDQLRKQLVSGMSEEEIRMSWQEDLEKFKVTREKYLLYPDF